ncbi:MAG TPA: ketopantoate reductase family protein [Gammaproteobacteria bacterium]|nr:ketopantoate reductase family protein [Gammaproteobacteria bacterium]
MGTDTWYVLGAGNMGVLAGRYLAAAGLRMRYLVPETAGPLERTLVFDRDGRRLGVRLECLDPGRLEEPVAHLLLATKAGQTAGAMAPLAGRLDQSVEILRLQNGMGSLEGVPLPRAARVIEAVTTSGAWRRGREHHVVAENVTLLGDGSASPPAWFTTLEPCWPGLRWCVDIRHQQLLKLSVNAVVNPLTAVFDCANGELRERPDLLPLVEAVAREVDEVLARLDPRWPGDTMDRCLEVARATAGNTSSMRSDVHAGRATEIDYINGWIIRRAGTLGLDVPENRRLLQAVRERHPPA